MLGPRGDIVWMCAPRWDSDAVFSALLDGPGGYSITPVDRFVWGGFYEEGSMSRLMRRKLPPVIRTTAETVSTSFLSPGSRSSPSSCQ